MAAVAILGGSGALVLLFAALSAARYAHTGLRHWLRRAMLSLIVALPVFAIWMLLALIAAAS